VVVSFSLHCKHELLTISDIANRFVPARLFNAFQAFSELASTMMGRPIVNKHRAYAFHRPSALWIAQIMVDMLFSSIQIMVFSIMVYFMCHLVRDAGAFFTFYLMIVSGYLAMTLFFRTVGCLCPGNKKNHFDC
jgi:ATP-binding cassette subfamily G (WHITE) protein 2 (SNQ2)